MKSIEITNMKINISDNSQKQEFKRLRGVTLQLEDLASHYD
jgi:hypothetical protein